MKDAWRDCASHTVGGKLVTVPSPTHAVTAPGGKPSPPKSESERKCLVVSLMGDSSTMRLHNGNATHKTQHRVDPSS